MSLSMTDVARAALSGRMAQGARLVRLSKAADTSVEEVSGAEVTVWVPATVSSSPQRGPKPTREYGVYRIGLSPESLIAFDVKNESGAKSVTLSCVLFHNQGVQLVDFDMAQVADAVIDYCAERGKGYHDKMTFQVRRTRGQRDFKLTIGARELVAVKASGWTKVHTLIGKLGNLLT